MKGAGLIPWLWEQNEGRYFCVSTRGTRWKDWWFERDEFDDVVKLVGEQSERGLDVYWCVHGYRRPKRLKEFAVPSLWLWSDMDAADPRKCKWQPTVAIRTSQQRFAGMWKLDQDADESLNRQLTYALDADRSGWPYTKVLRAPGSRNQKYEPAPLVRVMWSDGPQYWRKRLERELPEVEGLPQGEADVDLGDLDTDWRGILAKYRLLKLSLYVRLHVPEGKRSDVLYRLGMDLIEAGATASEVASVLWASRAGQSKYGNRRALESEVARLFRRKR